MSEDKAFAGKVIVVTGAGAGVGRAVATLFAREGAKLGLISRDGAALDALANELSATGAERTATAPIDVSDANAVFAAADRFAQELGPIDVWVNDAMLTVFSTVSEMSPDEFRRVTEVTYLGVVHGSMAALRHMREQARGQIINIGSALAYRGIPLQSAYCGAKHAIRGFTASLRTELEHDHSPVIVSILELPAMNTPQFDWARTHRAHQPKPMGTIYQPEAAAEAVLLAARTGAREYWVGTPTLMTIVGNDRARVHGLVPRPHRRERAGQAAPCPSGAARQSDEADHGPAPRPLLLRRGSEVARNHLSGRGDARGDRRRRRGDLFRARASGGPAREAAAGLPLIVWSLRHTS